MDQKKADELNKLYKVLKKETGYDVTSAASRAASLPSEDLHYLAERTAAEFPHLRCRLLNMLPEKFPRWVYWYIPMVEFANSNHAVRAVRHFLQHPPAGEYAHMQEKLVAYVSPYAHALQLNVQNLNIVCGVLLALFCYKASLILFDSFLHAARFLLNFKTPLDALTRAVNRVDARLLPATLTLIPLCDAAGKKTEKAKLKEMVLKQAKLLTQSNAVWLSSEQEKTLLSLLPSRWRLKLPGSLQHKNAVALLHAIGCCGGQLSLDRLHSLRVLEYGQHTPTARALWESLDALEVRVSAAQDQATLLRASNEAGELLRAAAGHAETEQDGRELLRSYAEAAEPAKEKVQADDVQPEHVQQAGLTGG